jgi:hypothetical protein
MIFLDNIHAEFNAFITDEHGGPGDKLPDLVLTLSAKRAIQGVFGISRT